MAFTITFPYDTGTFVLVDLDTYDENDPKKLINRLGTISCYQCVDGKHDELMVMVSGYKDAWCGEYLLNEIRLATDLEVDTYKDIMGIS
jgi:hypothetical protein